MSDKNEDLLNAAESPKTVTRKPRRPGKRVNNKPIMIVVFGALVIVVLLGIAVSNRMRPTPATDHAEADNNNGNAMDAARTFITSGAGLIDKPAVPVSDSTPPPKKPEVIRVLAMPKVETPKEAPTVKREALEKPPVIEKPIIDPNLARIRQRRFQMAETAVSSRVAVPTEESTQHSEPMKRDNAEYELQGARTAAQSASTSASLTDSDYSQRHDLSMTGQFAGNPNRWKSESVVEAPLSRYLLRTGSVIPATLISGINSELPGQIVGQVSQNVYDTATGRYLLVPQGSRLVGEYLSSIQYGQSRVFAAWQRIIFPDGKTLDLGAMPASSGAGYAGMKDRVNNHYTRIFGTALMMSAVVAGVDMTQNNDNSAGNKQRMGDAMSESLGNTFGNVIVEMMRKNLAIAPTLEIRPGFRLNVMLVKDLEFSGSYRAFDYVTR